jgi:hypothetical protein
VNKFYNGLLLAVVVSLSGLVASEKQFFDESTQNALQKPLRWYLGAYTAAWGIGNVLNVAFTTFFSPFAVVMGMAWKDSKLIDQALSPLSNVKQGNREICKALLKTTPVTAPIIFGSVVAWHKYKQNRDEKILQLTSNE